MKSILPLLAILGTFTGALLYFRADPPPPKRTAEAPIHPEVTTQPAKPEPVAPAPEVVITTAPAPVPSPAPKAPATDSASADFRALNTRLAAEQATKQLPVTDGEFQLIGVEILTSEHGTAFITGKVRNTGTRTAWTVWGTLDGKPTLCLHAAEPPAKPPLAPGQTILFKRPLPKSAAATGTAALSIHSIETTP